MPLTQVRAFVCVCLVLVSTCVHVWHVFTVLTLVLRRGAVAVVTRGGTREIESLVVQVSHGTLVLHVM